ncbi:carboxymuconolactone decarboxylase family protein [Nonomuraea sp. NPDC050783]|uniref:carboxymuconolactone decarboxylase family protein n=1 Tax=Nonomuraea sp. NPDC050783 TaxID=3154634 RepID=UPI0034677EAE
MTSRMELSSLVRDAYRGMATLDRFVAASPLPSSLVHLINLRASQINGCVYCVDMHSADAKKEGESDARLHAVVVWREAPFFTERERAALAFTEAATRLSTDDVSDEVWRRAAEHFDEEELAALVVAVAAINAWNRIGVATRMTPESYQP